MNEPQSPAPDAAPEVPVEAGPLSEATPAPDAIAAAEAIPAEIAAIAVTPPPSASGTPPGFRAGLAALVGRTNAGKSTLLNALVGRKISIVTPKPQTTRDTIHGIVHHPKGQVVFVDTPGFFHTRGTTLVQELHDRTREALSEIARVTVENLTSARSRIQDADFAAETAALTRLQILQQSGMAVLSQANNLPQGVLALLRQ